MKIGFIGVGSIAASVIRALEKVHGEGMALYLSPRSAQISAALAAQYKNAWVMQSNQEVVDSAEWVFVSVLPEQLREVLEPLRFGGEHRLVSLVADGSAAQLASWAGGVPLGGAHSAADLH